MTRTFNPAARPISADGRMVETATRRAMQAKALPGSAPSKLQPKSFGQQVDDALEKCEKVSNVSQLGVLATAAASVGVATGYGLVLGLSVKQAAQIVVDVRASYKSAVHAGKLKKLQHQAKLPPKWCGDRHFHSTVAYQVLPYIIDQKVEKAARRAVNATPLSFGESIYAAGRKGYKLFKGTLGEKRERMATNLATHLIDHECELAEQIVAELFDQDSMLWLKYRCQVAPAATILAARMASR